MSFRISFKSFNKTVRGIKSFVSCCGCGNYQKLPKHCLIPLDYVPPQESNEATPASHLEVRRSRGERNHGKASKRADSRGMNGEGSGRSRLVVRKIRELELLDLGNIEHVLDVEEVIHYYSLLKCPVYRGIVNEFFAEIYIEFQGGSAVAAEDTSGR